MRACVRACARVCVVCVHAHAHACVRLCVRAMHLSRRLSGLIPCSAREGSWPCAHSTCARARGMACCMQIGNDMKNDACMPKSLHGNCRDPQPCFPRTAEIGGSRKARLRAPGHAGKHSNKRTCMMTKHGRHMIHAKMHAHAHAACGPIPFVSVSIDTFFGGNDAGERGLGGLKCTCRHKQPLALQCTWPGKRPPPCPNAPKYACGKEAQKSQVEAKMKFERDNNA